MAMQKDVRDRWVKALRSGDYEQGSGYLCKENKYCCLGVLNDVQGNDFVLENGVRQYYNITEKAQSAVTTVRKYYDIDDRAQYSVTLNEGWLESQGLESHDVMRLWPMNDGRNASGEHIYSFSDIADFIEENVEVVE